MKKKNPVKKIIAIVLLTFLPCFAFGEEGNFSDSKLLQDWSDTSSGDYIIYRDYSWKEETWIGFLYYNSNTVASFLFTDNGKTFAKVLFSGEELDGEFIITGQRVVSEQNNDPNYIYAVNYLMQIFPKLYEWREKPAAESLVVKKSSKTVVEEEYGGECTVNFSSYIPLFYIDSIFNKEQKPVLKLTELGIAKGETEFFNFTPVKIEPKKEKTDFVLNTNAEKKEFSINNIKLNLDSQWSQHTENSFWLKDIALLVVAPINYEGIPDVKQDATKFIVKYFCMSSPEDKILLDKIDIVGSKEKFKIIKSVYDVQTKTERTVIQFVIKYKDLKYMIVSLAVDSDFYKNHREYFSKILLNF